MSPLDKVYRDAERYMRELKLRVPAEVHVATDGPTRTALGWRKMVPRGWSLVYIEHYSDAARSHWRVLPIAEAPEAFRLKAADFFGVLLDAVQAAPLPTIDDPAMQAISASLGESDE